MGGLGATISDPKTQRCRTSLVKQEMCRPLKELLLQSIEVAAVVTHSTNRIEISMDNIQLSAQGAERQRKDVPVLHVAFGMQMPHA